MRQVRLTLLFLLPLGACGPRSEGRPSSQESGVPISQTLTAQSHDSQPVRTDTTPAGAFSPEGYFFPTDPVLLANYQLRWLALEGHGAWLRLTRTTNEDDFLRVDCHLPTVTRDTVEVVCEGSPDGTILVQGAFVEPWAKYWSEGEIPEDKVVIAGGLIWEAPTGRTRRPIRFTYFGGD